MEYRQLGRSDLHISRIGFGSMSLDPAASGQNELIHQAIGLGINFFDTADLYNKGMNETMLGNALLGKREKLVLATKVGNQWNADDNDFHWNPSRKHILQSIDESLGRLRTDYIDLYQLHGGTTDDNTEETIDAFETLVRSGKIRYYGISSIRPNVIRRWIALSNMASVMMQYSLLDTRPEESCLTELQQANVGVLARGTVAGGLLAGKPAKVYLGRATDDVEKAATLISRFAGKNSPAAVAIQYVLQHPAITTAVVGIRTENQLQDAIAAATVEISPSTYLELHNALTPIVYTQHRN